LGLTAFSRYEHFYWKDKLGIFVMDVVDAYVDISDPSNPKPYLFETLLQPFDKSGLLSTPSSHFFSVFLFFGCTSAVVLQVSRQHQYHVPGLRRGKAGPSSVSGALSHKHVNCVNNLFTFHFCSCVVLI